MRYVILANGDYPTHPVPSARLTHPRVVCCDGAAAPFIAAGHTPLAIIGDGDSLPPDLRQRTDFIHIPDQETNDLTKAVGYCADNGATEIIILGATGKREDHTLGNISLLMEYARTGISLQMVTDHGVFLPCQGTRTITDDDEWWLPLLHRTSILRQEISVFNHTSTTLSATGLDYPLRPFRALWEGTLNYVSAPRFTITADGGFLLYLSYSFRQ